MKKHRRLQDEYQFPGYRPNAAIKGIFGDSHSLIVQLARLQKKLFAGVAEPYKGRSTTGKYAGYGICRVATSVFTWKSKSGGFSARNVVW
jgi:hypothetical protein